MKKPCLLLCTILTALVIRSTGLASLTDGLVAYYPFNGNANDAWNSHHGDPDGASLSLDRYGNSNSAYSFDDYQDIIRIPNEVLNGVEDFTFSTWVFIDFRDGTLGVHNWTILSGAESNANHNEAVFVALCEPYPDMVMWTNVHSLSGGSSSYAEGLVGNTWIHMTWVRYSDSGTVEFYIDGKSQFVESHAEWIGAISIPNANALWLGHDQDVPNGGYQTMDQFYGAMDEVTFWDRAFSSLEVEELYNQGGNPIPAPGAVILGGIGVAFVAHLRRRRAL